ncbi:MAG: PQQ-dependent sugar dehydrogenase [Actinomycetota bacterium]|nr:PQQ-dependent sugar dehydrogenase [Actinomycetota bacterium]
MPQPSQDTDGDAGPRRHAALRRAAAGLVAVAATVVACTRAGPADVAPTAAGPTAATTAAPAGAPTPERFSCPDAPPDAPAGDATTPHLALEPIVTGLVHPSLITAPPGDPRLFVLELDGRIRVVADGRLLDRPFLDLTDRAKAVGDGGLIGLAFHPRYAHNGRFFVHYDDLQADTVVAEYRVSGDDPNRADPNSARTLLTVDQPAVIQQGGTLTFGLDGMLYLGLGDGGDKSDGGARAADPRDLLGSLLRIDVDGPPAAGKAYAIPVDNPHADGMSGAPEVWATGLRNPWRFTFDGSRCQLIVADVGAKGREEINVVAADVGGLDFGWPAMEGSRCLRDACDGDRYVLPVAEYVHSSDACAIVGGEVYRGDAIVDLGGTYVFTDYCGGFLRGFRLPPPGEPADVVDFTDQVGRLGYPLSFGRDAAGEVYVAEAGGSVSRIVAAD